MATRVGYTGFVLIAYCKTAKQIFYRHTARITAHNSMAKYLYREDRHFFLAIIRPTDRLNT